MPITSLGTKIPSHGTDSFGQTYAFDFLQVEFSKDFIKFYKKRPLAYIMGRVHLKDYYCYGKPIYAPFSGTVVDARDGFPERDLLILFMIFLSHSRMLGHLKEKTIVFRKLQVIS